MRVLLIGSVPRLGAPNHLPWLRYTASALGRLGHAVRTVPYRESWAASPLLASAVGGWPGGRALLAGTVAAMAARRARTAIAAARTFKPQLTIVLKGEVYAPGVLAETKEFA